MKNPRFHNPIPFSFSPQFLSKQTVKINLLLPHPDFLPNYSKKPSNSQLTLNSATKNPKKNKIKTKIEYLEW